MSGVNRTVLLGNLGADPDLRFTTGGEPVAELRVATNESWLDKNRVKQERTEWHRVVVWGAQAENCKKFLHKGSGVYVEGRNQTRSWEDQEGQKRYTTEVVATRVHFTDRAPGGARPPHPSEGPPTDEAPAPTYDEAQRQLARPSDDLPF